MLTIEHGLGLKENDGNTIELEDNLEKEAFQIAKSFPLRAAASEDQKSQLAELKVRYAKLGKKRVDQIVSEAVAHSLHRGGGFKKLAPLLEESSVKQ